MKRLNTWFVLILIASALLLSTVKKGNGEPSPRPNESSDLANQQSAQQVAPVSSPNLSQPAQQDGTPKNEQQDGSNATTIVITVFTVITGFATVAIAKFNKQLVGVTDAMKEATAEAAKFTKLAYVATRPYLVPDNFVILNFTTQGRRTDQHGVVFMTVEFVLKNVGKGPATVKRAGAKLKILPDDPTNRRGWYPNPSDDWGDLSDCAGFALDSHVIAADGATKAQVLSNLPSEDDYLAVTVGYTGHIVVYGFLDYLDAAGEPYTAVFGRIYRPKNMLNEEHFTVGPAKYNRT
jgi:hypothetical protein